MRTIKRFVLELVNAAKKLFTLFREMDRRKIDVVFIEAVGEDGLGMAIMNRIRKAASEKISA